MMSAFRAEQFIVESSLSLELVREVLRPHFRRALGYYPWRGRRFPLFFGRLGESDFCIREASYGGMLGYTMSTAMGRLEAIETGTRISVEVFVGRRQKSRLVSVLVASGLVALMVVTYPALIGEPIKAANLLAAALVPLVALVWCVFYLALFASWPARDASRLREFLIKALECSSERASTSPPPRPLRP